MPIKLKLGDVSPLAGMITGEGLMGTLARNGGMGLVGKFATPDPEKEKKEAASKKATGMKRGGKVTSCNMAKGGSVKSRGDGCASRGKTKGRFV
jgi:hypothetical protein